MKSYRYTAVTGSNETRSGTLQGSSPDEVVEQLRAEGLVPVHIRVSGWRPEWPADLSLRQRKPGSRSLIEFTEQFSGLLEAGFTQERALRMIADSADPLDGKTADLRERIRGGSTLSQALEAHPVIFPSAYIRVVQAGEAGGTVAANLARLHEDLDRRRRLRDRLVSALIYPALLVALSFIALFMLLAFVVPRFMPIFEDLGGEPPLLTRVVMFVGQSLQSWGWLLVLIALVVFFVWRHRLTQPAFRYWQDDWLLRLPLVGALIVRAEVARFSRMLGTLLSNGVPMITALGLACDVLENRALRDEVAQATEWVREGGRFARALAQSGRFPELSIRMVEMGEETGALGATLLRASDALERELHVRIERLMALLVPLLTLSMALLIGLIVTSMLLAILDINQLIL